MPNWCSNFLTITPSSNDAEGKGFKNFKAKMSLVQDDMNETKEVWTGVCDYFVGHEDDFETNWYDHNCRVYGAKWQVSLEDFVGNYDDQDDCITLSFDSAWSPLTEFSKKLAGIYNLNIEHQYEERGNWFAGQLIVDGDEVIEEWSDGYWEGLYKIDSDHFFEMISNDFECWTEDVMEEISSYDSEEVVTEKATEYFDEKELEFLTTDELDELRNDFVKYVKEELVNNKIVEEAGLEQWKYYMIDGKPSRFVGYSNNAFNFNNKEGWFNLKELPKEIELSETQTF
jgi:hypothetical protein